MYSFYRIISKFSKIFSNVFLILAIPVSILLCGLGWCMFFIRDIIIAITNNEGLFDTANPSGASLTDSCEIIKWVGLALAIFIIVCYVILIVSWICRKVLFKKIADNYITRNKEWRNRDINKTIERLENYRYRD